MSENLIFFDLETTGLGHECHIIEIAAWKTHDLKDIPTEYTEKMKIRDNVFYSLVMPDKSINYSATQCHGISKVGQNELNVRGKHEYNVPNQKEVMENFITWLSEIDNPILIAYNGFRYSNFFRMSLIELRI